MSTTSESTTGGIGRRLRAALGNRVAWLTDDRRDASGAPSGSPALVVLLGREHYSERRRIYPISSRRDLDGVLRQELAGMPPTLTLIAPSRGDKREVVFFELRPDALARAGRCVWLVPETLALSATLPTGSVASVDRQGLRYFLAASGLSQVAAGAVTSAEMFALAAGLDARQTVAIPSEGLRGRLLSGLRHLPPETWLRFHLPALRPRLQIEWRPILIAAGASLVAYLMLVSAYLSITRDARERELAGLGEQVEKLLVAQRDVDRMLAEQQGLAAITAERRYTYRIWRVVSVAWGKGATLQSLELRDSTLTIRVSAPVATDVLAAVAAIPGFTDAKLASPVRRGEFDREDFTLALTLLPVTDRG